MDNLLIPALIVLIVTNVSFALLARSWKRKAAKTDRALMRHVLETASAHREGFDAGYRQAAKVATGGMYLAAMRVSSDDVVLAALRAQGRRLLGEPMDESVVQVPESV